ncbi:hypothetical protein [Geobacter argillaceus]|uniref:Lipoprotein n=1 Tax=Geobacter argillaceus TaxID=345631 RepID=A0A562V809_9BACT|nr:hypothetical protein [Geobacter argillaceus]TWJ14021.1 hypothetical protein JN12_03592 [Geobacter argillaceus]
MIWRIIVAVAMAWASGILSGCAATAPVSILYSPSVEARGGSGSLLLKSASYHAASSGENSTRWVIGKRKDSDGRVTGEILSVNSPDDMVLDALNRELTVTGYSVELGSSLPPDVAKALDLTTMQIELDETAGIPKAEVTCTVKVSMDVWKNGVRVRKLSYESKVSDFAIVDRNLLRREMIEKALRGIMSQAVPEIIAVLERKS